MKTKTSAAIAAAALSFSGLIGNALADEAPAPRSGVQQEGQHSSQRVIVVLKAPGGKSLSGTESRATEQAFTASLRATQNAVMADAFGSAEAGAQRAVRLFDLVPMFAANVTTAEMAKLKADPRVERVEPDGLSKPELLDSLPLIKMTGSSGAYALNAKGSGRVVVVLDTGVNKNHEFLKNKVIAEACFNSNVPGDGAASRCPGGGTTSTASGAGADCSASIEGCGHGTHVAGIAAGYNTSKSSGEPANGVAYSAKIMAINVFTRFSKDSGNCGAGATKDCVLSYTSDQIAALEYVRSKNRKIGTAYTIDSANMSLGGGVYSSYCNGDPRQPSMHALRVQGVATTVAAGNEYYVDAVSAPGCISDAITVSASSKRTTGKNERTSVYSNIASFVDLLAPGGDFGYPFNTSRDQIKSSFLNGGYGNLAGTSMAAPHVAGAVAAIRSRSACKYKSVTEIESAFRTTGTAIKDWRIVTGVPQITKRRLDVVAAMKKLGCAP